jgi:hypothetical protein
MSARFGLARHGAPESCPQLPQIPQRLDAATLIAHTRLLEVTDFAQVTPAVAVLVCIECRRSWVVGSERWRLKVTDDEPPKTVPYCPDCARREFGID